MKKLIAIVTIAIVLVGAVFAELGDTAPANQSGRITVRSEVARQDPTFVLKGGVSSNALNVIGNASATDYDGQELKQANMADWDISQANITAYFGIYQTTAAKNQFTYSFSVVPTHFVQYKNAAGADVTTNAYTVNKAVDIDGLNTDLWYVDSTSTTGYVEGISQSSTRPAVTDATTASGIDTLAGTVIFDGSAVVNSEAATTNVLICPFSITWTYDREAPAGKYQADVLLTVTVS